MTKKDEPKDAPKPGGFLSAIMASGPAGHGPQDKVDLAPKMYEGGKHLTMRSRIDRPTLNRIHRALLAADVMDFKPLKDAATLLMELLVSENGLGRGEAVAMLRATYTTQIGAQPSTDPALDG